jgi:hypothetical protein
MGIISIGILLAIAVSPSFVVYLLARRRRRLAEEECKMSAAVAAMDNLMLQSVLTHGEVCHDIVYDAMCRTQRHRDYGLKGFFSAPSEKQKKFMEKFEDETSSGDPRLQKALDTFASGYIKAAQIKSPLRFSMIIFILFAISGGLRMAIVAIKQVRNLKQAIQRVKRQMRTQYVARSMSVQT